MARLAPMARQSVPSLECWKKKRLRVTSRATGDVWHSREIAEPYDVQRFPDCVALTGMILLAGRFGVEKAVLLPAQAVEQGAGDENAHVVAIVTGFDAKRPRVLFASMVDVQSLADGLADA